MPTLELLSKGNLVAALNEWMRRYIEDPDGYEHEVTTVMEFIKEDTGDEEPDYGVVCAEMLFKIVLEQIEAEAKQAPTEEPEAGS